MVHLMRKYKKSILTVLIVLIIGPFVLWGGYAGRSRMARGKKAPTGPVPVATVGVGPGGARNAGLLAVQIMAVADADLRKKLLDYKQRLIHKVTARNEALRKRISGQSS